MSPFSCYLDEEGNVWMNPGPVIAFHATTVTFQIGRGGMGLVPFTGGAYAAVTGGGGGYQGGNGTNVTAATAGTPLASGTLVPWGKFRATGEDTWTAEGNPNLTVEFNGDGSADLRDTVDIVASTPAATSTIAPYGTFTATAHGETAYNGGSPWTVDMAYEGASNPFPARLASVQWTDDSSAQGGLYNRTGWQAWESADDPAWTITLDGTGAGEISDGTDVVAERAADAGRLYDPSGEWEPTAYGRAAYGDPVDATANTVTAGTFPDLTWTLVDSTGGIESWVGQVTPPIWLELDTATGDSLVRDEGGTIAERLAGSTTTPDGTYTATTYGQDTYNATAAFDITVATASEGTPFLGLAALARGVPAAGVLYVTLTVDGGDEVTATAGPFWNSAIPANTSTEKHVPVLTSDGAGLVTQVQIGPIYWRPSP